jgi:hypothetical protein
VIWAVSEREGASQKPFDGDPYTRLASDRMRSRGLYRARMCWFQGGRPAISCPRSDYPLLQLVVYDSVDSVNK